MQLIPSWRRAWRLWSVRVSAIAAAIFTMLLAAPDQLLAVWSTLPADVQALVPGAPKLGLILSIAAIVARLIAQHDEEGAPPVSSPLRTPLSNDRAAVTQIRDPRSAINGG